MSKADMLSYALKKRKHFEALLYIEGLDKKEETPSLTFTEGTKSYYKNKTIVIGVGGFKSRSEAELFVQIKHMLGVQVQHIRSTTRKDWDAAEILVLKQLCERISMEYLHTRRKLVKESDYEKFFEELEAKGIYLSVHTIKELVSLIAGTLEEGRVERIHTEKDPSFLDTRRIVRHLQYENNPLFPEGVDPIPYDKLNPAEKLKALQKQIQTLSTRERFQKGFLSTYIDSEFYDEAKEYLPLIAEAVQAKTCKECMSSAIDIINLMYDTLMNAAHYKGGIEQMMKEMFTAMANSPSDSDMPASPSSEEQGADEKPESLFGDSDLEVTLEDEDYDKMMEKDGGRSQHNKDGVNLKRKHDYDKNPPKPKKPNPSNPSDEEDGQNGENNGESGSQGGNSQNDNYESKDVSSENSSQMLNGNGSSNDSQNATDNDQESSQGSGSSSSCSSEDGENSDSDMQQGSGSSGNSDKSEENTEENANGKASSNGESDETSEDEGEDSSAGSSKDSDNDDEDADSNISTEDSSEDEESADNLDSQASFKESTKQEISDHGCADNSADDEAIKKLYEEALRSEESDIKRSEAFEKMEEDFQRKMEDFNNLEPKPTDTAPINSHYPYPVNLTEMVRNYKPDLSLPFHLESKGKSLKRKIEEIIYNKQSPDERALKSGSVDPTRLHKILQGDTKLFKKRGEMNQIDIAGYLLVDNSGSMGWGNGSTRNYACNALSVIEEAFSDFMPLKIAAFDSSGTRSVYHDIIKDFDENAPCNFTHNFCMKGRSGGGNKDGYSIRVATQQLLERGEKDKVLIVATDGLPSCYDANPSGSNDVKSAVQEARRNGIKVIGMYMYAYADDKTSLEYANMYEKDYFMTNVENIETELSRVMKRLFKEI